nr:MAG TPA: DNA binding response regulator [Caudoviricetes sp.]
MSNLKTDLSTKGTKCKLQFTTREKEYFEQECGFTDEELDIFRLRTRGYSVLQISFKMEELYGKYTPGGQYSISKVEARIRSIKKKILKVL